jgi:hypothetical protein
LVCIDVRRTSESASHILRIYGMAGAASAFVAGIVASSIVTPASDGIRRLRIKSPLRGLTRTFKIRNPKSQIQNRL